MANLLRIDSDVLYFTLSSLKAAGGTTEHTDWMRDRDNAALLIKFIDQQRGMFDKNPFEMSVEQHLTSLRHANDEEKWGILEEDFVRLAATAPAWPQGRYAYRSLRIRFGEGKEGIIKTFEAHCARVEHVFGQSHFHRMKHLYSGKVEHNGEPVERLWLLNGSHTHRPCVEWIVADLDTNRERKSITAVRDHESLADELLVIAWMFPDMIRAMDYEKIFGLFAAGYESHIPELGTGLWQFVVFVGFDRTDAKVHISAYHGMNNINCHSVPLLRK